jgi:hypothetical protein
MANLVILIFLSLLPFQLLAWQPSGVSMTEDHFQARGQSILKLRRQEPTIDPLDAPPPEDDGLDLNPTEVDEGSGNDTGTGEQATPGFLDPQAPEETKEVEPKNDTSNITIPDALDVLEDWEAAYNPDPIRATIGTFVLSSFLIICALICVISNEMRTRRIIRLFDQKMSQKIPEVQRVEEEKVAPAREQPILPPIAPLAPQAVQSARVDIPPPMTTSIQMTATQVPEQKKAAGDQPGKPPERPGDKPADKPGDKPPEKPGDKPPQNQDKPPGAAPEKKEISALPTGFVSLQGKINIVENPFDSVTGFTRPVLYIEREVDIMEPKLKPETSKMQEMIAKVTSPAPAGIGWSPGVKDMKAMRHIAPNIESNDSDNLVFLFDEIFLPPSMKVGKYVCPGSMVAKIQRENGDLLEPKKVKLSDVDRSLFGGKDTRPIFKQYMQRYYPHHDATVEGDYLLIRALSEATLARDMRVLYRVASVEEPLTIIAGFEGNKLAPVEWNYKGNVIQTKNTKRHANQQENFFFVFYEIYYRLLEWMEPRVQIFFIEKGTLDRQTVLARNKARQLKGTWPTRIMLFLLILFAFEISVTNLLGTAVMQKVGNRNFLQKSLFGGLLSLALTTCFYGLSLFFLWLTHSCLISLTCLVFSGIGGAGVWALLKYL